MTKQQTEALKPGDRVRHWKTGEVGTVIETHFPCWVDWRPDNWDTGHLEGALRTDPSNLKRATPSPAPSDTRDVQNAIAEAIREADDSLRYSFNLTRLVDGVATHTLSMPGFDPLDFDDRDEGYAIIEQRRNQVRAAAILKTLGGSHD